MILTRRLGILLLALGVVTAAIYGTGAFAGLSADRSADVSVTGDASGYISLKPADGSGGVYAEQDTRGKLMLHFDEGVNPDSSTEFENVFTITNQRAETVGFWLGDMNDAVTFYVGEEKIGESKDGAIILEPGKTKHVRIEVDAMNVEAGQEMLQSLRFHVSSKVKGKNVRSGPSASSNSHSQFGVGDSDADIGQTSDSKPKDSSDGQSSRNDDSISNKGMDLLGKGWEATKALTLGFATGNFGMPGGWFTAKESSSPLYLLGQLLNAAAPWGMDMVFDLRDIVANVISGEVFSWENALNAVGLLPVLGSVDDASDMRKIVSNWIDAFPSKADEARSFISHAFIKHLPDSIGKRLLKITSDAPVGELTKKGVPVDDIIKYQDEGADFNRVLELRDQGIPPEDIRFYVDEGIDLKLVKEVRKEGMKPQRIRFRLGDGSKVSVQTLIDQGYSRKEIVSLIDKGADLKKASKLQAEGMPRADINYYVKNSIQLSGAGKLRKMGFSSKNTKVILKAVKHADELDKKKVTEKEVKIINRKIGGDIRLSKSSLEVAKAAVNTKNWNEEREKPNAK